MSRLGIREEIIGTRKEYLLDRVTGILEPDAAVYKTMAMLFKLNGYVVGKPPYPSDLREGKAYRYRFFVHLCSDRRGDLEWINDYFPGEIWKFAVPPPARNPLDGDKLLFHWRVDGLQAGVICDDLLEYAETPRGRHLLEQTVRGTRPRSSGWYADRRNRDASVVRKLRASIMEDVNTLCSNWPLRHHDMKKRKKG